MNTTWLRLGIVLFAASVLGSCGLLRKGPGMAVVELYNNGGRTILVEDNEVRPGRSGTFEYPVDSGHALIVFWGGCVHTYIAPNRRPGEFRGTDWMLRGRYRVQLEADGSLFVIPPGSDIPGDVKTMAQPEGFPLRPREGSSCVRNPAS